jgi:predicted small secreted protein
MKKPVKTIVLFLLLATLLLAACTPPNESIF